MKKIFPGISTTTLVPTPSKLSAVICVAGTVVLFVHREQGAVAGVCWKQKRTGVSIRLDLISLPSEIPYICILLLLSSVQRVCDH